jgi:hypothetical protein
VVGTLGKELGPVLGEAVGERLGPILVEASGAALVE